MAPDAIPVVADVDRITAGADAVVRNLQITQCYHELSLALAARTGSSANWCTFAVWASKQVGATIRKEDLARALEQLWETSSEVSIVAPASGSRSRVASSGDRRAHSPLHRPSASLVITALSRSASLPDLADYRRRIREAVLATSSFERASDAVARGNKKIFKEIAGEFARFLAAFADDTVFDPDKIVTFCAGLRPGDPPEGQRYLAQACASYHRAMFENDAKTRDELLLLGNVAVGLHEQTRLQPEILDALHAPVLDPRECRQRLLEVFLPELGWLARLRWRLKSRIGLHNPLDLAVSRLVEQARLLSRVVVTEHIMTLGLPGGASLKLGQDLRAEFPPALAHLLNADLLALLDLADPTPDSLRETAVPDWSVLSDRMHFIADLFRCFQPEPTLLSPPFSAEQVAILKDGRRPQGRL